MGIIERWAKDYDLPVWRVKRIVDMYGTDNIHELLEQELIDGVDWEDDDDD